MLLAVFFAVLTLLAAVLLIQAVRLRTRHVRSFRIYAAAFGIVFGYLLAELPVTAYYGLSWAGTSFHVFDESGKTVHFDPIRGYLLTEQPSRWGRITNGKFEYLAWLKGNSQGFPTRTDFGPARPDDSTRRIAVFGDSFSSGDYLETNWPDRAEALAQAHGEKLQLLNFSLLGAGLANWWSTLTRLVAPQNYALDGIVFVVFEDDLERKFLVAENRGASLTWRRCSSWDPQTYPATLEQTRACPCSFGSAYILSDSEFEQVLKKKWPPSIPRTEVRPALANQIVDYLDRWWDSKWDSKREPGRAPGFGPEQARLIHDIGEFVSTRKLPALVVFLPRREELVKSTWGNDPHRAEAKVFAREIGATFLDGSSAFANLQPADIWKCFFPYDGHWNQEGSDRFAKFMLELIQRSFPNRLQASR